VNEIFTITSDKIIQTDHFVTFSQQAVTKMGTEEARGSCKKNFHEILLLLFNKPFESQVSDSPKK
jgi:hypothetical protein